MEHIRSRPRAKTVACIDLVLTTIGIVYSVYIFFQFAFESEKISKFSQAFSLSEAATRSLITVLWIHKSLHGLYLCANLWAAYNLYLQTQPEANDTFEAYKRACIWRSINLAFILAVWVIAVYFYTVNVWLGVFATFSTVDHVILLACVWGFITELEKCPNVVSGNPASGFPKV